MSRLFLFGSLATALAAFWFSVPAQAGGLYVSTELGMNFGRAMDMLGASNDRASVCDGYINPRYSDVENTPGYTSYNCTGPDRGSTGDWQNGFSSAQGILFGAALGYRVRDSRFRIELEYFYRDTGYDEVSDIQAASGESGDKLEQELVLATDGIDSMVSHNPFANLYVDFTNDSKFTPYIGMGAGFGFTEVDYSSVWARNSDAGQIDTGAGLPNADEIRANLAGTTSVGLAKLEDTLFGYQALIGVDYELNESLLLGVKGRWIKFESLMDSGVVWDPLRGHPPYLRTPEQVAGGDREFVEGRIRLDDIEMFAVSLSLKYQF